MPGQVTTGALVHEGEQAVQRRLGEGGPGHGSPMFDAQVPDAYAEFLAERRMVVLGSVSDDDAVWASALTGPAGFVGVPDPTSILIAASPPSGDPLAGLAAVERPAALIAVDQLAGRRIRANGRIARSGDALLLRTEQVLRNCKKYIQRRVVEETRPAPATRPSARRSTDLTTSQRRWVASADTFFLASHSPRHGSDVSHRGGRPGFVTVANARHLSWPDYRGNSFYMTFGNLELNPNAGVLFVDWERGHTLQLTGRCAVDWDDRGSPEAQRTVHFLVHRVVQVDNASALRWRFVESSPFNPT